VRVEEWNASYPDLAMKMVPFTRNVFQSGRFKFRVSYISGLVLDKNGDILKPYFEGNGERRDLHHALRLHHDMSAGGRFAGVRPEAGGVRGDSLQRDRSL